MNQAPGGDPAALPEWLAPIAEAARTISFADLTRFAVPEGVATRHAAVLVLFGEGERGPEILLTERAHTMRTQPGQVAFPGGSVDPGESATEAALREAREETGLDPSGVQVFAALPSLWLPPSSFVVDPVLAWWRDPGPVGVVDPGEVHAIHLEPVSELLDPDHRFSVHHPSGFVGPGFQIGPDKDVVLWGFTAGVLSRLFDYVGWTRPWDVGRRRELPSYMLSPEHRDGAGEGRRP